MKKYSVLSIAILAVSAIAAAFTPSKATTQTRTGEIQLDLFDNNDTCITGGDAICDHTQTEQGQAASFNSLSATGDSTANTQSANPNGTDDNAESEAQGTTTFS